MPCLLANRSRICIDGSIDVIVRLISPAPGQSIYKHRDTNEPHNLHLRHRVPVSRVGVADLTASWVALQSGNAPAEKTKIKTRAEGEKKISEKKGLRPDTAFL